MTERDRAPRKARIFGVARLFRTPLHQPDARIQHGFEARPKRHRVAWLGGNEIHGRQPRRRDDGLVGGGEGVSGQIIGRHPYHRLPLPAMRLASKGVHTPHVQQDRPIGIIVTYADQRSCLLHLDADLFIELACERRGRGLARLDLAAWKLPTPSLMPMGGAASNEHAPCGVDDHRHRYVHDLCNGQHAGFFAIHDGTVERITTCLLIPYRSPTVNKVMLWLMREFPAQKGEAHVTYQCIGGHDGADHASPGIVAVLVRLQRLYRGLAVEPADQTLALESNRLRLDSPTTPPLPASPCAHCRRCAPLTVWARAKPPT